MFVQRSVDEYDEDSIKFGIYREKINVKFERIKLESIVSIATLKRMGSSKQKIFIKCFRELT